MTEPQQPTAANDPELTPWEANLARRLTALRDLPPPPSFAPAATRRFVAQFQRGPTRTRIPQFSLVPRLGLRLAVVLVALFLALGGVSYAAAASLPGAPLYGLKRQVESVQFALSPQDQHPALAEQLVERRLEEVVTLIGQQAPVAHVTLGVDEYTAASAVYGNLLTQPRREPLFQRHLQVLTSLKHRAPQDTQATIEGAERAAAAQLAPPVPPTVVPAPVLRTPTPMTPPATVSPRPSLTATPEQPAASPTPHPAPTAHHPSPHVPVPALTALPSHPPHPPAPPAREKPNDEAPSMPTQTPAPTPERPEPPRAEPSGGPVATPERPDHPRAEPSGGPVATPERPGHPGGQPSESPPQAPAPQPSEQPTPAEDNDQHQRPPEAAPSAVAPNPPPPAPTEARPSDKPEPSDGPGEHPRPPEAAPSAVAPNPPPPAPTESRPPDKPEPRPAPHDGPHSDAPAPPAHHEKH